MKNLKSCGIDGSVCRQRFPFTIGTDPEFGLEGGHHAQDNATQTQSWHRDKEFLCGFDAAANVFEIRPQAAYCAHALVENTRLALAAQKEYFTRIRRKIVAQAMVGGRLPAGGHIHFGIQNNRENDVPRLARALDAVVIPAVKAIFDPDSWQARRRTGYGERGDYRTDNRWGFEWRPLPTFLAEKGLTLAVYALCGAVVQQAMEKREWDFEEEHKLLDIQNLPVVKKHWREISYLAWLKKMGYRIREENDLTVVWGLKQKPKRKKTEPVIVGEVM